MGQMVSNYLQSWINPWVLYFFEMRMKRLGSRIEPSDFRTWEVYDYKGVPLFLDILRSTMEDLKTLEIREDDVFIVTYPKTGTTWTQEIMSCIMNDGDLAKINKKHSFNRVPFLELTVGGYVHDHLPKTHKMVGWMPRSSPRLIKSHLPGQLLPPQVWEKKIKIVYVIRNPKDVATSYFHHVQLLNPHRQFDWDDFFDRFHTGTIGYGKWWEHYLYFWARRNEDHILFLRFEDSKKDLRGTVERIRKFLGKTLSDDVIDDIADHCTFENMKKNPMTNPDTLIKGQGGRTFMRKGTVNDWKTHLSEAQSESVDTLCKEKLTGAGLTFDQNS